MAGLEKISESLQLAESKKDGLEKSILALMGQWKDFEGELDLAQKGFGQGLRELDCFEKCLNSKKKTLELSMNLVRQRYKEVRDREKDFDLFREKKIRDLELREVEFNRIKEVATEEIVEELNEKEKRVYELIDALESGKLQYEAFVENKLKEMEKKENYLETKKKEVESSQILIEKRTRELEFWENKRKEADMIQILMDKRTRELQHNEAKMKERERKVELKEEEINLWKERQSGIKSKERQLQLMIQDLEFQEKNSDFIRQLNEKRMEELDLKEKQLDENFKLKEKEYESGKEFLEKGLKDLESKRKAFEEEIKEFELRKNELSESLKEFHMKNKDFLSQKKLLEEESQKLQQNKDQFREKVEQFELAEKERKNSLKKKESLLGTELLEKESKDLESKWREYKHRMEEFNVRREMLEKSIEEFQVKEKQFDLEKKLVEKESKHLESRRKEQEEISKKFELGERELESNKKKLELEKKLLEKYSKHLESSRKELEGRIEKFELREKELELKEKKFESGKKLLEKDSKRLESRKKELEDSIQKFELGEKELDLKVKQLGGATHAHLKAEPVHDAVSESLSCYDIDLRFVVVMMGGKDLQIFLNGLEKDHHLMAEQVLAALHLSKDPAKLVLDAMEGFFPPHLRNDNGEFSANIVRRSCMLLLQQLIRIPPRVQPCVREEALKLAREWKTKLNNGNPLEVSSFLYLLGAYDVASGFDAEDIMICLESFSKHHQKLEPELCGRLGLKEKIPSVVENLLKSNQSMKAIEFIFGFELVDRFPPVPILKSYLKSFKMYTFAMLRKAPNKKNVKNESIDKRVAAMRAVIKCIVDHKLESEYPPKDIENSIKQLLMQKKGKKPGGSLNCHKGQGEQKVEVKQISSTAAPSQLNAHSHAPDISNTRRGLSHPMAVIIANMDGKNLLSFLSSHVNEHELLHTEVSSALQISDNSPKLVLDTVKNLYDSPMKEEETKSCIFLLEQLMKLSPDIMPDVKEAAQNIAFDWQAKLKAENGNSFLTIAYPLFVSAYRLDLQFHRVELLNLCQTVSEQKTSPGLSHAIGISKDVSNAAVLQSEVEKSLLVEDLTAACMIPELDGESECTDMDFEWQEGFSVHSEAPAFIKLSSDPTSLVLDALKNCHWSNFSENRSLQMVKSFFHLLEQLMSVPLEIKPNVKQQAFEFALDWKAKSVGVHSWEALAFLQLVAAYQLSSFFSSDDLFSCLEVVYASKKGGNLIRIFGLVDKVQAFISKLIAQKKLLLAFAYVYDFELVEMFPPVALLKQHVLYSKVVAKKILHKANKTTDAQDKSIVSEISALKAVIKLIIQHHLQSEYPLDELRSAIKELESRRTNLRTSMQKMDANEISHAPKVQVQRMNTKRRFTSDSSHLSEDHLQAANKFRRLASPPSQSSKPHPIPSEPPLSHHPGEKSFQRTH